MHKESNYTYRDALEVSAYLIKVGKFGRFYKEMQIADLQKELDQMDKEELCNSNEVIGDKKFDYCCKLVRNG